jgi:hypothetical protein
MNRMILCTGNNTAHKKAGKKPAFIIESAPAA